MHFLSLVNHGYPYSAKEAFVPAICEYLFPRGPPELATTLSPPVRYLKLPDVRSLLPYKHSGLGKVAMVCVLMSCAGAVC
mmetsp:Transcript_13667/g.22215  ORF Transcript_13667/g.22215 Transcript_13667/m.22215 type:complete len:80 (-) Transcript_13667:478-717(-)